MQLGGCVFGAPGLSDSTAMIAALPDGHDESNLSHTSPWCHQPASLRLKTSSCCDWWEIQRVCNISERTFHWSSRTCRAEPKQRDFGLAGNPSSYFLVNRCRPARRDRVKPTTNTWKKLWHTNTHQTQKLTWFSGLVPSEEMCPSDIQKLAPLRLTVIPVFACRRWTVHFHCKHPFLIYIHKRQ